MKTHLVIDLVDIENEGNEEFSGTELECIEYVYNSGGPFFHI
jgi:hypothetical protein